MNRTSTEKRAQILACLAEGNSIRATSRLTGAAINTVIKLLCDADYRHVSTSHADLANDLPRYRLTLAEEISHRELEPDLWKAGVPVGACIYELDAQLYDDVEGDAYRLALAILMPAGYFKERFELLKNQITSAAKEPKDINPLTVEIMAKEFEVTFDACASRCHVLNICKVQIKKPKLPGSVIF